MRCLLRLGAGAQHRGAGGDFECGVYGALTKQRVFRSFMMLKDLSDALIKSSPSVFRWRPSAILFPLQGGRFLFPVPGQFVVTSEWRHVLRGEGRACGADCFLRVPRYSIMKCGAPWLQGHRSPFKSPQELHQLQASMLSFLCSSPPHKKNYWPNW